MAETTSTSYLGKVSVDLEFISLQTNVATLGTKNQVIGPCIMALCHELELELTCNCAWCPSSPFLQVLPSGA